jgi:hypothetical protein
MAWRKCAVCGEMGTVKPKGEHKPGDAVEVVAFPCEHSWTINAKGEDEVPARK